MSKPLTVLLLLVSSSAFATAIEPGLRDLMQARNIAMGGAYRAHGLGAESAFGNPAALSMYKRYQVELSGAWDITTKYAFGSVAIADSTQEVSAGVAYHLVTLGRGEKRRIAHFNTVASAYAISENIHVGVSARHLLMTGAREANAITMDAGLLVRLTEGLSIGFSGHNLIDTANPELTRYYALAAAWVIGGLTAAFDVRADFGIADVPVQMAYGGGLEYILADMFPLRAGYSYDTVMGTQHISCGLGYAYQGGGIDLAYRHELAGNDGRLLMLTFKMQM
jgi:hypothetical protein